MTEENTQDQAVTEAAQAPAETPAETTQHQETPEATEQHQETQEVELRTDANTAEGVSTMSPEVTTAVLHAAVIGLEISVDALAELQAEVDKLRAALEN